MISFSYDLYSQEEVAARLSMYKLSTENGAEEDEEEKRRKKEKQVLTNIHRI